MEVVFRFIPRLNRTARPGGSNFRKAILGLLFPFCLLPASLPGQAPLVVDSVSVPGTGGHIVLEWREDAAERALRSGLSVLAETLYREIMAVPGLAPERVARNRLHLAAALISQRKFAAARKELELIPPEQKSPEYHLYSAVAAYGDGAAVDVDRVRDSLRQIVPVALSVEDRPWFHLVDGLLAEIEGAEGRARAAFGRAREGAVSEAQTAFFESLILREELRRSAASEELAADLRGRLQGMEGDPAAFPYVREYAVVLDLLGRKAEATVAIDRELESGTAYGNREREQLRLLKALILGADSLGGRAALRELVRSGQSREVMSIALQLLVRSRSPLDTAELVRFFDELIARTDPHPLLGEIYYMRSQLSLAMGETQRAEADARLLLEQFPGLREITDVYRLLAYASLQRTPPQYRTAADFLIQLRDVTEAGAERSALDRLIGDCYFMNGDYANAADFYLAARRPGLDLGGGNPLFLRLITAEVRSGKIDAALRHIDEADFRGVTSVAERWKAEWNLIQALQAQGQLDRALDRVRLLLTDTAGGVPAALDLRLRWLEARLAFLAGEREGLSGRVDALLLRIRALPANALGAEEAELLITEVMLLKAGILIRSGAAAEGLAVLEELRTGYAKSSAAERSYLTEANYLGATGDFPGAQRVLSRLATTYPQSVLAPQALYEAALYGERQGPERYAEAVVLLNELAANYPEDPLVFPARLKQGDLLRLMNDFAGAQIVYENLINRQPEHPRRYLAEIARADCMLAFARDNEGPLRDVALVLEQLLDLPNLPADLQVEAGYKWGFALSRRGAEAEARAVFTLMTARFLLDPEAASALGEPGRYWMSRILLDQGTLLEKSGELSEARRIYGLIGRYNLPGRQLAQARSDALLIVDR